jgi:hypothetical protein
MVSLIARLMVRSCWGGTVICVHPPPRMYSLPPVYCAESHSSIRASMSVGEPEIVSVGAYMFRACGVCCVIVPFGFSRFFSWFSSCGVS